VIHATSAEFFADFIGSRQTEVSDGNSKTIVEAENILRLEVAVVDSKRMTIFHGV